MASDEADSEGESSGGKEGQEGRQGQAGEGRSGASEKQQAADRDSRKDAGESSSLMSKLKDAFQDLMSRTRPRQGEKGAGQQGKEKQQAQARPQQGAQGGKDGQQRDGGQLGGAPEGENGQEARNSGEAQQGKGQGKSDSDQAGKQPGTGIGTQDGDKAIHEAEQLAAMGKISQILGKRAAAITGEATVEVQTTHQQLRTPYAQKGAQHTQGGAEINRDEVPVALQPYVQQYFEQVRKQADAQGVKR